MSCTRELRCPLLGQGDGVAANDGQYLVAFGTLRQLGRRQAFKVSHRARLVRADQGRRFPRPVCAGHRLARVGLDPSMAPAFVAALSGRRWAGPLIASELGRPVPRAVTVAEDTGLLPARINIICTTVGANPELVDGCCWAQEMAEDRSPDGCRASQVRRQ